MRPQLKRMQASSPYEHTHQQATPQAHRHLSFIVQSWCCYDTLRGSNPGSALWSPVDISLCLFQTRPLCCLCYLRYGCPGRHWAWGLDSSVFPKWKDSPLLCKGLLLHFTEMAFPGTYIQYCPFIPARFNTVSSNGRCPKNRPILHCWKWPNLNIWLKIFSRAAAYFHEEENMYQCECSSSAEHLIKQRCSNTWSYVSNDSVEWMWNMYL